MKNQKAHGLTGRGLLLTLNLIFLAKHLDHEGIARCF
jgi:hypothetical protein